MSQRVQRLGWVLLVASCVWLAMAVAAGATAGPAGQISGTVTEAGFGPVEGVDVLAYGPDGFSASATTDASGNYTIGTGWEGALPAGTYTVSFTTYEPYRMQYYGGTVDETAATPVVLTDAEGQVGINAVWTGIAGVIKRPDGVGMTQATISAYDAAAAAGEGWVADATPDANGSYELWVPAGSYDLHYWAYEGAGGQFWSGDASSQADAVPVSVTDVALTTNDVQFTAVKGSLTGPGGALRSGYAQVHPAADTRFEDGMGVAATDGTYEVWVAPGSYRVQFSDADTFAVQYYPGTRNRADATAVTTSVDAPTATADAVWYRIAGAVTWIDGAPDTKAEVSLLEPVLETYVDPDTGEVYSYETTVDYRATELTAGAYDFVVAPGTYKLRVDHYEAHVYAEQYYGAQATFDAADLIVVGPAPAAPEVTNADVRFVAIQGTVKRAGDGTGISGVSVDAFDPAVASLDESLGWAETASDGTYSLVLPPGSYQVRAYPGDSPRWLTGALDRTEAATVALSGGANLTGQDFLVETITGSIGVPGTLDAQNSYVQFSNDGPDAADHHDDEYYYGAIASDGSYEVFAPPGSYLGQFWVATATGADGYAWSGDASTEETATEVVLPAGGTVAQNARFRSISGTVSGGGVTRATVDAFRQGLVDASAYYGEHYTNAKADGSYELLVPPGEYKVGFQGINDAGGLFTGASVYSGGARTLTAAPVRDLRTANLPAEDAAFTTITGTFSTGATAPNEYSVNAINPAGTDADYTYGWTDSQTAAFTLLVPAGAPAHTLEYSTYAYSTATQGAAGGYGFSNGTSAPVSTLAASSPVAGGTTGLAVPFNPVRGTIKNAGGAAITADASVDFFDFNPASPLDDGNHVGWANVNADGTYGTFLPAGTYKAAFGTWTLAFEDYRWFDNDSSFAAALPITVPAANNNAINIQFTAPGTIAGTVTEQGTTTKLGGICVGAFDETGHQVGKATTSSDSSLLGTYSMTVPSGSYKVRFIDCSNYVYKDEWHPNTTQSLAQFVDVPSGGALTGIDASLESGFVPEEPKVSTVTTLTGTSTTDPRTGEVQIDMQNSAKSAVTLTVPITCDSGSPTAVKLTHGGKDFTATSVSGSNYTFTIPVEDVVDGPITTSHTCGATPTTTTVGRIELFDPSGFVTDSVTKQIITGATVHLYEVPGWTPWTNPDVAKGATQCENMDTRTGDAWTQPAPTAVGVLADAESGRQDPAANMQLTNSIGRYGWDVAMGCWYVVVQKAGYHTKVSPVVGVPPEVTNLDIELVPLPDTTAPAKVGSMKALPVAAGTKPDTNIAKKAKLSWTKPTATDLAGFELKVKTGTTTVKTLTLPRTVSLPYTVTGLTQGKTYSFAVRAYDTAAVRNYSSAATVKLHGTALSAAAPAKVVKGKNALISGKLTKVGNIALGGKSVQLQVRTLVSGTKYTAWANSGKPTTTSKLAASKGTYKFTRAVSKKSKFRVLFGPSSGTALGSISPTKTVALK